MVKVDIDIASGSLTIVGLTGAEQDEQNGDIYTRSSSRPGIITLKLGVGT